MRIEYENKFRDILLFNGIHQFLSPILQIFYLLCAIGVASVYSQNVSYLAIIVGIFFYIAAWVIQLIFNIFYLYSKKDKSILTKHIIEIQDDALYEETKYNKSFFYWDGIVKIVRRPRFIAIYISKNMAHIIPKRAFKSEDERSKFYNGVKEKLSMERNNVN